VGPLKLLVKVGGKLKRVGKHCFIGLFVVVGLGQN